MPSTAMEQFRLSFRGDLIQPGDASYDSARSVCNGMIDKHPALIARCMDTADVIAAVEYGHENGMLTAVRCGGHNGADLGLLYFHHGLLVIDLSLMKGTRVDPEQRTITVQGGCVWGDVDHATHPFGLAVPSGYISTTGVSGLTLGGGMGHLTRQYGLTIDSLIEADVVLADGRFVHANARENEDLFWALRGGGGNFGVVTSFVFRAHPVKTVYAGPTFWSVELADNVMKYYREFILKAPREVNGFFAYLTIPPVPMFPSTLHNRKVCGIMWCCNTTSEKGEAETKSMRSIGKPVFEHMGLLPFPAVQSFFDALYPPGLQWYWRADFMKELNDDAVAKYIEYGSEPPTAHSTVHLYPIDGAAHNVNRTDTAFSYRDANWAEVIVGVDPDPANNAKITKWCRDFYNAVHPFSAGGAYVNFMMEEGQERIKTSFRENYSRLATIKKEYDPDNFFRVNQNIRPA